MRETEKRIRQYQARLPHIRERIIASLMIFAFSVVMMTMSAFAWVTLSVSPEVSGVTTTIAANGNLEIALADSIVYVMQGDKLVPLKDANGNVVPKAPDDSAIGDSGLVLAKRNTTWGNIVNLSDPSYGLDSIVLRPASINMLDLAKHPLFAAEYGVDGRIVKLDSAFEYTQYDAEKGEFLASELKGVKAIASADYKEVSYDQDQAILKVYFDLEQKAGEYLRDARVAFNDLANQMDSIAGLMGTYMDSVLKKTTDTEPCKGSDVENLYNLMLNLQKSMNYAGQAMMTIFEMYQANTEAQYEYTPYKFTDLDDFCAKFSEELQKMNQARPEDKKIDSSVFMSMFKITTSGKKLEGYIADKQLLDTYIANFENGIVDRAKAGDGIMWSEISAEVNGLVDINTCKIFDSNGKGYTPSQISGSMSVALDMLGSTRETVVYNGLVKRVDALLHDGNGIRVEGLTVSVSKDALKAALEDRGYPSILANTVTARITVNISTDAPDVYPTSTSVTDLANAKNIVGAQNVSREFTAMDTYGLSIDFWIRTNAPYSYLTLEGEVIPQYDPVFETVNGQSVQIYLATITTTTTDTSQKDDKGNPVENVSVLEDQEVYQIEGDWYYLSTHAAVKSTSSYDVKDDAGNIVGTVTAETKVTSQTEKQTKTIVGYSGVNRIWEEQAHLLPEYSTSQGSGSCYTFYADPTDLSAILNLLDLMRIVFVDVSGNELATAKLDTSLCYSNYGQHVVPMVLHSGYDEFTNDEGETERAITRLNRNEATMISAIIYLDGASVRNDMVLSSAEINGQFNIQFGGSYTAISIGNEKLMEEEIRITAAVSKAEWTREEIAAAKEAGRELDFTTTVTLTVDGAQPERLEGYFLREITSTQGSRQKKMKFTKQKDGTWTFDYRFESPGTYVLRTVQADGIERKLANSTLLTVTIPGFELTSVSGQHDTMYSVLTSNTFEREEFTLRMGAGPGGSLPSVAKGIFVNENNISVTVDFKPSSENPEIWTGEALFTVSGTYRMEYVLLDGEIYPLTQAITRDVSLGLRTRVWLSTNKNEYAPDEELTIVDGNYQYVFLGSDHPHEFSIRVKIYDNANTEITNLPGVILNYTNELDAGLYWNSASGEYVGEFCIEDPGIYEFVSVELDLNGDNTVDSSIDLAISAPNVTAVPKEPVKFNGISNEIASYTLAAAGENATIVFAFEHADAATAYGLFKRETSTATTYYIARADRNEAGTEFTFKIPSEDGYWSLLGVKLENVYNEPEDGEGAFLRGDGSFTKNEDDSNITLDANTGLLMLANGIDAKALFEGAEDYYEITLETLETYDNYVESTKVVKNVTYSITYPTKYEGHQFMQAYTINAGDIEATLVDFENKVIPNEYVSNMSFTYERQGGTSKDYGGYTFEESVNDNFNFVLTNSNGTFVNMAADSVNLDVAGKYWTIFSYTLKVGENGKEKSQTYDFYSDSYKNGSDGDSEIDKLPIVEVYTTKPTVTINAISPIGSVPTKIKYEETKKWGMTTNVTFSVYEDRTNSYDADENLVTLYARAKYDNSSIQHRGDFTLPTLKLTMSGMGAADGATLVIPAKGELSAVKYEYKKDGELSKTIGSQKIIKEWKLLGIGHELYGYYGYGENVVIESFTLVKNGVTYTVTLDKPLIINNPSSVNQ